MANDNWWESAPVATQENSEGEWWKSAPVAESMQKPDPFSEAKSYLQGAGDGLPEDVKKLPEDQQFDAFKAKSIPFHSVNPLERLGNAISDGTSSMLSHPLQSAGNALRATSYAVGGLAYNAYEGMGNAASEQVRDYRENPLKAAITTPYKSLLALNEGGAVGAYGLGELGAKLVSKASDVAQDIGSSPQDAAEARAHTDFLMRKYNDAKKPIVESLANSTGMPATFAVGEQVAPLAIPIGVGLETASIAPKIADGIVNFVPKATADILDTGAGAARVVQASTPYVAPIVAAGEGFSHYGPLGGMLGLAGERGLANLIERPVVNGATRVGDALRGAADRVASADTSGFVGTRQAIGAGINAGASTLTGAGLGLAGSPSGSEGEGALQGAAFGAFASPIAAIHGGFARQGLEQAVRTGEFIDAGQRPYGDKVLDAQHDEAMANLSPEDQAQVNAARGLYRGLSDNGKPVRIVVQDQEPFMKGVEEVNGGQLPAGNIPAGYYNHDTATVHLNSDSATGDIGVTLAHALGHEATHPLSSVVSGINPEQARTLQVSTARAAVNPDGSIKPEFQRFIDAYNGGKPVDWNSLPDTSETGLSKNYYFHELGAQTGAALDAIRNPGKYALPPEASDLVFNALGDYARSKGIIEGPDVSLGLPANTAPIPADASLYANSREAFRTIAQAPRSPVDAYSRSRQNPSATPLYDPADFQRQPLSIGPRPSNGTPADAPLEASQPIGTAPSTLSGNVVRPAATQTNSTEPAQRQSATGENTSPNATANPRTTQAYQDAMALATLPKSMGGLGMKAEDVAPRLDTAAFNPDVPNTAGDYLFHMQTGRVRDSRVSNNPQGQSPVQSDVSAPNLTLATPVEQPRSLDNSPASVPLSPTQQEQAPTQPIQQPESAQGSQSLVNPSVDSPLAPTTPAGDNTPSSSVLSPQPERNSQAGTGPATQRRPSSSLVISPSAQGAEPALPVSEVGTANREGQGLDLAQPKSNTQVQQSQRQASQSPANEESSSPQASVAVEEPQVQTGRNPSGLTADDVARIKQESANSFTYTGPKPSKKTLAENPNALEERVNAAKRENEINALFSAHEPFVQDGESVQLRIDPDTGKPSIKGRAFNEDDPVHQEILSHLDDDTRKSVDAVQSAIADGKPLNFDYMSAATKGTGTTGTGRKVAQKASTATARAEGDGAIEESDKLHYPLSMSVTGQGAVTSFGFSPDKVIGNAQRLLTYFSDRGDNTVPYRNVNNPEFIKDYRGYAENQANGWKGDGSGPLQSAGGIEIQANPDYQPHALTPEKSQFMNLVTQGDQALAKTGTQKGESIRQFAKANGLTPDAATNEVNALRAQIDARNDLQAVTKKGQVTGTGKVLESPFETIRTDLISNLNPITDEPATTSNIRAQAFRGDRRALTEGGLPSGKIAGAGFLPSADDSILHKPKPDGSRAFDLTENGVFPDDVYTHPHYYDDTSAAHTKESLRALRAIKGKPDAMVTVYRAAPKDSEIRAGDWVSLSKKYVQMHSESVGADQIISKQVKARDIRSPGDDLNEFGYFPENQSASFLPSKPQDLGEFNPSELGRRIATGTESTIFLSKDGKSVMRYTRPNDDGLYGRTPAVVDGKIKEAPSSQEDFIQRLNLANQVFGENTSVQGVASSGGKQLIASSQPYYGDFRTDASYPEIKDYMRGLGFEQKGNGWYRESDNVYASDVAEGNFKKTPDGIQAIDVPVVKATPEMQKILGVKQPANFLPASDSQPITDNPAPYGYNALKSGVFSRIVASSVSETASKFPSAKAFGDSLENSQETSVMNNVTDKPYQGTFSPGKLYIDKYGENPYVYQAKYIDPQTLKGNLKLEGKTYEEVVNMPSTQKYIEWYKQGNQPPPIDVVLQGDNKIPKSTNRRRVIAALEAGVKQIPAVVEIGQRDDIWKAVNTK